MTAEKRTYECEICRELYEPSGTAQKYCANCIPNRSAFNRYLGWNICQPRWIEILKEQNNSCAICKTPFDLSKSAKKGSGIFIDHDHSTGRMRGVLCNGCNHGLGWVEKENWLNYAQNYIRKYVQMNVVYHDDALTTLSKIDDNSIDLVYIDPPFGTGNRQQLTRKKQGEIVSTVSYEDPNDDYIGWLRQHMIEIKRVLKQSGTVYLHLDQRWSHYAHVMMDEVFGRENYLNSIVWSYNFGGRSKEKWPAKHDNILVFSKHMRDHVFNLNEIPRIPYAAPDMQYVGRSKEEAEKRIKQGQIPTDVWELSIVGTNSKERNGYPTQKPIKLIERAVLASSPKGGVVLDVFAGSGTTGAAAHKHGRSFILADLSPWAIETMRERFKEVTVDWK